ncbi:hypothetical protein SAMN05444149_105399 [Pseudosulfitobacter pseudonitzschiae]|uniref:Phage protein n=1 Tax=Pseudosulfitobacter pseudonitzschiae TaxID=1402135 RepID=A0A073IWD2_9RHOB|nr:hypothetical protein [Pseudosulfitobacter pseudonitzschiae]KEJ93920.1 hypothetical protein SUH3_12095 [Pseudosulfitobacter pseudonitzschiae]QKS08542.1 hypothetical protein HT745_08660 [Pseudosulfitobacter pseudonitzschiae]SHF77763.1 hypothetical protein SAMN05444149_105399 [Pseudosulfitobacter pseudonitzschiae]|tara:strand:+ start:3462 stop:3719 length:258 start_codon:yes stop_codon:yes gene_type:complete
MSKVSLADLNDHLFDQLDRLADQSLSPEQTDTEIRKAAAMVGLADRISTNADLSLKAAKLFAEHGPTILPHLPKIGNQDKARGGS